MITSGCSLSAANERKRFQEMIAPVWRVDRDAFGCNQWPRFHIRQHIQKNANRVSCAACLELVQVQTQTITSQERNGSLLWMPGSRWRSRALFGMMVSRNAAQLLLPYQ